MHPLAPYMPIDRRLALARGESLPDRASGAALFADISGFTPLARTFANELGSKRGAEALLAVMNPVFEALVGPLHRYGGSVVFFVGDAITCWFDDERSTVGAQPSARRAVACALAMQEAMTRFASVSTLAGPPAALSVKVAVAAGPARRFLVGDPVIHVLEALAGATLERMAAAENQAGEGEIVVSQEVAERLAGDLTVAEWRAEAESGRRFAVVAGLTTEAPLSPWPVLAHDALDEDQIRPWLLPAVYEQLDCGLGVLGDLRPVTPLMLRFGGLDYDSDDEAGARLGAYICWVQAIIHRYGGVLHELVIGDKGTWLYAPFGAPLAHEDDNHRALAAALALQSPPPELSFVGPVQIGISRGEVWTGACGAAARRTYGVMGSEVNLAVRLMTKARPGETLVSGRVGRQPGFNFEPLGDVAYKGFDLPIPTCRLLGEETAEQRVFAGRMVGRQAELAQLVAFAQPLFAGRFAGMAYIYGEPGIGKSRLSYALHQALGERVAWYTGQTDPILRRAFNPFVYWLKRYFHQSSEANPKENKARFEQRYSRLLTDLTGLRNLSGLKEELVRTRSVLGALLGLRWPGSLYEELDAKLRYENSLYALQTLLLAESCLHPLVFEMEDAQWLDAASQELLAVIDRTAGGYPLLLIVTARYADNGSRPDFGSKHGPALLLDLDALGAEDLRALAEAQLGGSLSAFLLEHLAEKAGGNPFFVEQTLLDLKERGALGLDREGWTILPGRLGELPETINALLIARIDRLSAQVQEAVKAAAVLGREFEVRILSEMLKGEGLDAPPGALVQEAEKQEIWIRL